MKLLNLERKKNGTRTVHLIVEIILLILEWVRWEKNMRLLI